MTRSTGRLGRRDPKRTRAIPFSRIFTGKVPAYPAAADNLARLGGGWQMLGNDVAGDCVAVTWANVRRLVTAICGTENYPTQDQVWAVYKTQNPGFDPDGTAETNGPGSSHDQGMDIQTLLEYLVKHGGPDGVKALGFAKVDPTNPDEVKAAISIFGSLWTGIVVQRANQDEFAEGKPWDYHRNSRDEGGHSVLTGGYGPPGDGPLGGDERMETWAEETSFTDRYWNRKVEEIWVVIWPEHLQHPSFQEGIDLAAFAAAYEAITGRAFPVDVTPTPEPAPTPPPAPTPATDPRLVQAAALVQEADGLMQAVVHGNSTNGG